MKTLKERLIAGHLALGWREDTIDRSRYTCMTKLVMDKDGACHLLKHFIGENGALRSGECASRSHSLQFGRTDIVEKYLKAGDERLGLVDGKKPTVEMNAAKLLEMLKDDSVPSFEEHRPE